MNYGEVQSIAKHTLCFIKNMIKPGMKLREVRMLCEEKMLELGADSFWYWEVGAFVFWAMKQRYLCLAEITRHRTGKYWKMIL